MVEDLEKMLQTANKTCEVSELIYYIINIILCDWRGRGIPPLLTKNFAVISVKVSHFKHLNWKPLSF